MVMLSVFDQVPIFSGCTATQAVQESIALAQEVERLGYRRFWVAEHHNNEIFACAAPEVLLSAIAATTTRMRVGSGGVMLPNYGPLKVVETFRMLHMLFPDRIDLGIGHGTEAGEQACRALKSSVPSAKSEQYEQQIRDLASFLGNALPAEHPFSDILTMPDRPGGPDIWLVGAGSYGVASAATLGLSFCFGQIFRNQLCPQVIESYRQQFRPSLRLQQPRASLVVRVLCADTEEQAQRLATSFWLFSLILQGRAKRTGIPGQPLRFPSVEEAASYGYSERDYAFMCENELMLIAGDPIQVRIRLLTLAQLYEVDELVILTICPDYKARLRSFQLLAQVMG